MKIKIDREEKISLLEFVRNGEIDTQKIPRIYEEIKGIDSFLELMQSLPDPEEYEQS